nr:ABC transporter ATP-binding protein [Methylonatrum kenyense]
MLLEARRPIPLDIRLRVAPGELVALVGPSGSGKSTILRCIAGLHRPDKGSIRIGQEQWLDTGTNRMCPPQQRRVGIVFQDYLLFPHLTARQNLTLAMTGGTAAEQRQRSDQLLEQVHLTGLAERYPAQLSGGQQQRVAVARALARDPSVLLLDEPFSAVDRSTRTRLQRELALLRRSIDIPMVLVTHDLEEARAMADRICVIQAGCGLQDADPETLFRRPRTARVARLLGSYNIFRGERGGSANTPELQWGSVRLRPGKEWRDQPAGSVEWFIPESDIVLQRPEATKTGPDDNGIQGCIQECVSLGNRTSLRVVCPDANATLSLDVPHHRARRQRLTTGEIVWLRLLQDGIHPLQPE